MKVIKSIEDKSIRSRKIFRSQVHIKEIIRSRKIFRSQVHIKEMTEQLKNTISSTCNMYREHREQRETPIL